ILKCESRLVFLAAFGSEVTLRLLSQSLRVFISTVTLAVQFIHRFGRGFLEVSSMRANPKTVLACDLRLGFRADAFTDDVADSFLNCGLCLRSSSLIDFRSYALLNCFSNGALRTDRNFLSADGLHDRTCLVACKIDEVACTMNRSRSTESRLARPAENFLQCLWVEVSV